MTHAARILHRTIAGGDAFQITAASQEAVQQHINRIMASVELCGGVAEFVNPYRLICGEWQSRGYAQSWDEFSFAGYYGP